MNSKVNLYLFFCSIYIFLYFLSTMLFYSFSISMGNNGINVPLFGGGDDGVFYYEQALNSLEGLPVILTSIHIKVIAFVMRIFSTEEVYVIRWFNFTGNILVLFTSLKIMKVLNNLAFKSSSAIILVVLLAIYPSLLLNSTISINRDIWIILFYLLALLFTFYFWSSKEIGMKIVWLIILIPTLYILFGYREYALLSYFLSLAIYGLYILLSKIRMKSRNIIIISFTLVSFIYTFLRTIKFPFVGMSIQDILMYRTLGMNEYSGGSQMMISLDQSNFFLFVFNYSYSVLSNAVGPFFWQITGISSLILIFTECVILYFVIYKIYISRYFLCKMEIFLILNGVMWFLLIGIFNDNIGTAARLRMVGWVPIFIVFAKIYGTSLLKTRDFIE